MFSTWSQKFDFLKSGQLITGLSKAWIGAQNEVLSIPNTTVTGQLSEYAITHVRFSIPENNTASNSHEYSNPSTIVNHSADFIAGRLNFPILIVRTVVSAFTTTSTDWNQGQINISIYGKYEDGSPYGSTISYYSKYQSMSSTVQFTSDTLSKKYYYISETLYNPDYSNIDSGSWFKPIYVLKQYDNIQLSIHYTGNRATFTHSALQIDIFILGCIYT